MKAKHIKKIKENMQSFLVLRSDGLFGDFNDYFGNTKSIDSYTEVMARSPKEAAFRFMKRTNAIKDFIRYDETPDESNKTFGKLKVLPKSKPFENHATYWA